MALLNILTQVGLHPFNGVVGEDSVYNTWISTHDEADVEDASIAAEVMILPFYNTATSSTKSISDYIASSITRTANRNTLRFFHLVDLSGAGGSLLPIRDDTWTLGAFDEAVINLPSQVCSVVSFHGDTTNIPEKVGNTRPAARRRGRLFIGPLTNNASVSDPITGDSVLSSIFRATLAAAADRVIDDHSGAWKVWSRADEALYPVTGGFVNSTWDIQRRRRLKSFTRTNWGVA